MISCNLKNGLGNQMFQIAAAYSLALENNDSCAFDFNKCSTLEQGYASNRYKDNLFSKINTTNNFLSAKIYFEKKFSYDKIPYSNNLLIDGFFQSENYFANNKKEIIDLFTIDEDYINIIKELLPIFDKPDKPITSVSIRRGDYLTKSKYHNILPFDYYNQAIKYVGDSYFVFISDDMNWVKNNFNDKNYYFPLFKNELLDFILITMCDNNIIANSTFSWWGSYLNKKNPLVIAPKNWFGPDGPKDTQDLYLKNWLVI